ncbi:ribonuclease-III-like-domain-containing protein [Cokeromyces recurvatus]|uniref:ribonuclease-III-like-domain-containing protein n=1 Tax=Cokeromyces recurvatus TaxID=90255 RepID=UPI0022206397|nr:ribonuclease-III-like-domain-containing protein [Cokeromyces recurvatus]KAI7900260.1 ribonuclease-III-like-domain-containing protein [Cokeromyces recurvatus]
MLRVNTLKWITVQRCSFHTSRTALIEKAMSPSFNVEANAKKLNISPDTLIQALTHKSYKHGNVPFNERLQYLGRRSLEFFATESLMNKTKNVDQLEMSVKELFNKNNLVSKFDALDLEKGLQCHLPSKEAVTPAVKLKALEAVIGAIYHEQGLNAAREFVKKHILA